MQTGKLLQRQTGFTYLTILFFIAIASIVLAQIGIDWSQAGQREKEKQLLYVGNQYRQAIMLYYEHSPGAIKRYPAKLEDLLSDSRYNPVQHYLRTLYCDPVTNQKQWNLIVAPEGGIMGVSSLSSRQPIKTTNFAYADRAFERAGSYANWTFTYVPQAVLLQQSPPH